MEKLNNPAARFHSLLKIGQSQKKDEQCAKVWGNILNVAQDILILQNYWWMWGPVGIVISVFVLCVNFIGDGLRDSTDPSQQG